MLSHFKNLFKLTGQVIKKCELQNSFQNEKLSVLNCGSCLKYQAQNFHTSTPRMRISKELERRKAARADARADGKVPDTFKGNVASKRTEGFFPTVDLPNTLFEGVPFKDLPIVFIKTTRNNTILSLVDQGWIKILRSCGTEGFKNTRKGTNIAAQATGSALGVRAVKRGYKNVRVVIGGLGPGRLSSIKGLQLSGMQIVSITDKTIDFSSLRARKQRRL